jgi:metal-responsive CopG/Arc/MetJ family transcriptional regulator
MRGPRRTPTTKADKAPERHGVLVRLPKPLLDQIDAIAAREERPRTKMIEIALRQWVQGQRAA